MSHPRLVLPGNTYLVTRRCLRRHFLLRPEYFVNNLFVFLLAVLADKYEILINAFCIVSTHEHLVLTDTLGKLPDFLRDLHRLTALALKVHRKWEGSVWGSEQTSVVHLRTPEAIKVSPYQRATSWEDIRGIDPSIAVGRGQREARKLAIAAIKTFRRAYRAALELWRNGNRSAIFPRGTWWMAVFHGAPVVDSG
jgi:REP element-mobilizing transposase RayT